MQSSAFSPAPAGDDQAWQELKTLLEKRVAGAMAGEFSTMSIDAVVEEELSRESRECVSQ